MRRRREGREGSEVARGVAALETSAAVCSRGGADDEERETTEGMEVPGGGAPLTIWSSFEPVITAVGSY